MLNCCCGTLTRVSHHQIICENYKFNKIVQVNETIREFERPIPLTRRETYSTSREFINSVSTKPFLNKKQNKFCSLLLD